MYRYIYAVYMYTVYTGVYIYAVHTVYSSQVLQRLLLVRSSSGCVCACSLSVTVVTVYYGK